MSEKRGYRGRLLITAIILVAVLVLNLFSISRLLNVSVLWPIDESNMDGYLVSSSYFLSTIAFLLTLSEIFLTKGLTSEKVESSLEENSAALVEEQETEYESPPIQDIEMIEEKIGHKKELENETIEDELEITEENDAKEEKLDEEFEYFSEPVDEELEYEIEEESELEGNEIVYQDDQAETGLDFLDRTVLEQPSLEIPEFDEKSKDDDPYYNKYKISSVRQENTKDTSLPDSELVNTLNEFEILVNDLRSRVKKNQE
jgi:hypothetical protein